ncbi:MAG: hypothetical protein AB8B72_01525 [Crocinitomicaceae bacterium]
MFSKFWHSNAYWEFKLSRALYLAPFIIFLLFLIDSWTFGFTEMLLFGSFLMSILPFAVIGVVFSINGLLRTKRNSSNLNKDIGYLELVIGLSLCLLGIIAWGVIYIIKYGSSLQ